MIDIHAHILPGMDDGAEDLQDALDMAKIAVENGITTMVATPHCNIPGIYDNYLDRRFVDIYKRVCRELEAHEIPLKLLPGMEVFATPDLPELLQTKKLVTLNGSKYLLVEFEFEEDLRYVESILESIFRAGLCPVVAHAERYECVQKNLFVLEKWKNRGVVIQVNKGSLTGRFGRFSYNAAHSMMQRRLVDVIASDCHSPHYRTPVMMDVYDSLQKKYSKEYLELLFNENPRRICSNQAIQNTGVSVINGGI